MKILIITWLFPPSSGGIESYTLNLARRLSAKNDVSVLTSGENQKYTGEHKERFRTYRLDEMYPYNCSKKDLEKIRKKLEKIIEEQEIEIIHSHNIVDLPTEFSKNIINTANKLKIPLIDHCHDARLKNINPELSKEKIEKIIAVSNFVKKRLISQGFDKDKIKVIYNSVSEINFSKNNKIKENIKQKFNIPNKKIILFPSRAIRPSTGKFGEQKNFETLYKSAKIIKEKFGKEFCIIFPMKVGFKENKIERDKTIMELNKRIKSDKLEGNIIGINKKIPYSEMPDLYAIADVMCTPSIEEAFGLVHVESMFMGVPTIGAKSGATPELIKNNETGYLIEPIDFESLGKIISKLLKNKKLAKKIGSAGEKFAKRKFSENKMMKEIGKTYQEVLSK